MVSWQVVRMYDQLRRMGDNIDHPESGEHLSFCSEGSGLAQAMLSSPLESYAFLKAFPCLLQPPSAVLVHLVSTALVAAFVLV